MLYDLNIAWSPGPNSAAELDKTLRFSASQGYDVVALNHIIGPPPYSGPPTNPLPKFPSSSSSSSSSTLVFNPTSTPTYSPSNNPRLPTILHRGTITYSDPGRDHRLSHVAPLYSILAVRPTTEKAFQAACLNLSDVSIISLDLAVRHPFYFRAKQCMTAVKRGIRFEICYAQALSSPGGAGDEETRSRRATFVGNVFQLVRATRGRGIVLSSEARSVMGIRAPADVVNLLHVWGLPTDKAMEGLRSIPRGVAVNEGIKRSGFRGVVDIVGLAERQVREGGDQEGPADQTRDKSNGKNQNTNAGRKRKHAGDQGQKTDDATSVGAAANDAVEDGPQEEQAMSKRQAKRLKAALRKKQHEER